MNPATDTVYATVDEAIAFGEDPDELMTVEERDAKIKSIIAQQVRADKARNEAKRQAEKKRRVAAQASRKKNRRKK